MRRISCYIVAFSFFFTSCSTQGMINNKKTTTQNSIAAVEPTYLEKVEQKKITEDTFWYNLFLEYGNEPYYFNQYEHVEERIKDNPEELLMEGLINSNPLVRWYCIYKILEYVNAENKDEIRIRLENAVDNSLEYVKSAAAFALAVLDGDFDRQGFIKSASGKKAAYARYNEAKYNDGRILVTGEGKTNIVNVGINAFPTAWSPDEKKVVVSLAARTWIDTNIIDVQTGIVSKTSILEYITKHADRYDFKIGKNERPDPYIQFIEWSLDSSKVLLSYSFTDDLHTRQAGAVVYAINNKAVDWMVKLLPSAGEHVLVEKPEGFSWDRADYGLENGLVSLDILNGEGVYNRKNMDEAVKEYVNALNTSSVNKLRAFTDSKDLPERFNDIALKTAIEHYSAYFREKKIIRHEFAGICPYAQQSATYLLFNEDGRYKEVSFHWDSHKGYLSVDNFLYYSDYANRYVNVFTKALSEEDTERLAVILTEDDLVYPEDKAPEIIKNFKMYFDLKSIHYKFEGNTEGEAGRGAFIFTIYGKSNGFPAEHGIRVIYGDGLVALRDELIPSIQQTQGDGSSVLTLP